MDEIAGRAVELVKAAIPGCRAEAITCPHILVAFSDEKIGKDGRMAMGHVLVSSREVRETDDLDALIGARVRAATETYISKQAEYA